MALSVRYCTATKCPLLKVLCPWLTRVEVGLVWHLMSRHCLVSCGENSNPALSHGMWFASSVLAPALSEGARGATVRRAGRLRAASPSTAVVETRSAAAASFARCIMVDSYCRQSGGAKSGGSPDKAGATNKKLRGVFVRGVA
jgi:hypothetical protein